MDEIDNAAEHSSWLNDSDLQEELNAEFGRQQARTDQVSAAAREHPELELASVEVAMACQRLVAIYRELGMTPVQAISALTHSLSQWVFEVYEIDDASTDLQRRSNALLREALEAIEWHREDGHGPPQCSACDGWGDGTGHTQECIVGRALANS